MSLPKPQARGMVESGRADRRGPVYRDPGKTCLRNKGKGETRKAAQLAGMAGHLYLCQRLSCHVSGRNRIWVTAYTAEAMQKHIPATNIIAKIRTGAVW